jgi:2'-5' RNA ligase
MPEHAAHPRTSPATTDSLFFAIYPDDTAARHIERLARHMRAQLSLKGQPAATERFHVTLHYLGAFAGVPTDVVAKAREAAAAVTAAATSPFEVTLDRVASFSGRRGKRPLVLQAGGAPPELAALYEGLGNALLAAGLSPRAHPHFTPHVTLLYDERHVREQPVEPIGWRVHEFCLVRSLLGKSRYETIARWTLGA